MDDEYGEVPLNDWPCWNYRIVLHDVDDKHGERGFAIHAVYYGEGGAVTSFDRTPSMAGALDLDDMKVELFRMFGAFDKPYLTYTDKEGLK